VQQRLEDEVLRGGGVGEVQIGDELVRGESDDVGEFVRVVERCGRGRREETDRNTLLAVHEDLVERPDLGAGKAVLRERGVLWRRRRRGAKDGLTCQGGKRYEASGTLTKTTGIPPRI
jgi:hypothetical protein